MKNLFVFTFFVFLYSFCSAQEKSVISSDFENSAIGQIPEAWLVNLTGNGEMSEWSIVKDNENTVLAQISVFTEDYRFNLIENDTLLTQNFELEVKFKAVNGKIDQGGGLIWRFQDENNYYVARANPLENNFRLYKVVNGNRKQLKSADIKMNTQQWYQIKIQMNDDKIKCFFDGKLALEATDNSFSQKGKVGLWTKSDAYTYFDDFKMVLNK